MTITKDKSKRRLERYRGRVAWARKRFLASLGFGRREIANSAAIYAAAVRALRRALVAAASPAEARGSRRR